MQDFSAVEITQMNGQIATLESISPRSQECFRRVTNRGRGARAGEEIWGNSRSPGWNNS